MKKNYMKVFYVAIFLLINTQSMMAAVSNPPTELPVAPEHEESEVLSIYSDVYTNATTVTTSGKGAMPEQVVLDDNMLYFESGLGGWEGWSHVELATALDISSYRTFFLDIYVVSGTTDLRVRFGDDTSVFNIRVNEGWNKVEIDLNDYKILSDVPNFASVNKISFFNASGYERTVYIDNLYASKSTPTELQNAPTTQAPTPSHKIEDVLSIFSDKYGDDLAFQIAGTAPTRKLKAIPFEEELDKMIFIKDGLNNGNNAITLTNSIDIDEYEYLHLDIYVTAGPFTMRGNFGTGTISLDLSPLVVGWNSIDIDLSLFKGQVNSADFTQFKTFAFWNKNGYARTVFVDNIYAHKDPLPVSINNEDAVELSVYPNPVVDRVFVESTNDIASISVFNTTGKQVKVQSGNESKYEIDFSDFNNGIYFLQVFFADGNIITKKILKQ